MIVTRVTFGFLRDRSQTIALVSKDTRKRMFAIATALVAVFSVGAETEEGRNMLDFAKIDLEIEEARGEWGVPGAAVAIVVDGKLAHSRGFGVRSLESGGLVDADTVFAAGSIAKSFAAATVGQLVASQQVGWDDRVRQHIPWFELYDDEVSEVVTVRDLLSMRTGIAESTKVFRVAARDRVDLVRRMRALPPVGAFRDQMVYSTDNYTAVGLVVQAVTGLPWEDVVKQQIWTPLGMTRTNADHTVAREWLNIAVPHILIEGSLSAIPWIYEDRAAVPAGGVNSSVNDLAKWAELLLAEGAASQVQILPKAAVRAMMTLNTPDRGLGQIGLLSQILGGGQGGLRNPGYGLGLMLYDYHQVRVVSHSGVTDGFRSLMVLLPDQKFGIIVLSNSPHELFGLAVSQYLVDAELGLPDKAWMSNMLGFEAFVQGANLASERITAENRRSDLPPLDLSAYEGRYRDGGSFGLIEISTNPEGRLVMAADEVRFMLEHWGRDSFAAYRQWPYPVPRSFFLSFQLDETGKVVAISTSYGDSFQKVLGD